MRTGNTGDITITYPDAVVAMFARNPITMKGFTGTSVEMTVTNSDNGDYAKDSRAPFENECFFDLSYYLGILYNTASVDEVDYTFAKKVLSAEFSVSLNFMNGTTNVGSFSFSVCGMWASVLSYGNETLKMFTGYPFTVGVYSNGGYTAAGFTLSGRGMYNVPVGAAQTVSVSDGTNVVQTIKVEETCGEGVYLRWVDKYGVFRYWLFRRGNVTTAVSNDGKIVRKNTGTDFGKRRTSKKVNEKVEICAPLVNSQEFGFLLGVAASPVVDMYSDGEWYPVEIEGGDIVKERSELQDFVVSVVLPDFVMQSL